MFCRKCSNDKFITIRVYRNRCIVGDKIVYSDDKDVRQIVCEKCGDRIHTETRMVNRIGYSKEKNSQITLPFKDDE